MLFCLEIEFYPKTQFNETPILNFELDAQNTLKYLSIFIFLLLTANILGIAAKLNLEHPYVEDIATLFDFNSEQNIPTFYSSLALLVCALLNLIVAQKHKLSGNPYFLWFGLALIFTFLAIDEIASLHEKLSSVVRRFFNTSGLFFYGWVIPYMIALLVIAAIYSRFLLQLPGKTMILFFVSAFIFVSGAVGFELLAGRQYELSGKDNLHYYMFYTCEEFLEMLGIAVFIYTLIDYISEITDKISINMSSQ